MTKKIKKRKRCSANQGPAGGTRREKKKRKKQRELQSLEDRTCKRGNLGPQVSRLLSDRASDGRALHITLGVHDDTSVVLKVDERAIAAPPWLALTDDDCGVDLLTKLGLALLARGKDHVANTTTRKTVETTLGVVDSDDGKSLSTGVVSAVDCRSDRKTARNLQLAAHTVTLRRHFCSKTIRTTLTQQKI